MDDKTRPLTAKQALSIDIQRQLQSLENAAAETLWSGAPIIKGLRMLMLERARTPEIAPDEDWFEEIISDTIDMDWRPRDAAKAIVRRWNERWYSDANHPSPSQPTGSDTQEAL